MSELITKTIGVLLLLAFMMSTAYFTIPSDKYNWTTCKPMGTVEDSTSTDVLYVYHCEKQLRVKE